MSDAHDERIRTLELHHAATVVRLDHVETQQRQLQKDLTRVSRESRDELHALRGQQQSDTERLLTAINANKIAWSLMSGGQKAAAWIIGTLIALGGLGLAVVHGIRKLFIQD